MTVGDLQELLAMLPDDLAVCIEADAGARHITAVDKAPRRRVDAEIAAAWEATGRPTVEVDGRHPPALILRGKGPLWFSAFGSDVDYELRGRWPVAAYSDGDYGVTA